MSELCTFVYTCCKKSLSIEVPYNGRYWQHNATKNNKHDSTDEQGDALNFTIIISLRIIFPQQNTVIGKIMNGAVFLSLKLAQISAHTHHMCAHVCVEYAAAAQAVSRFAAEVHDMSRPLQGDR